MSNCLIFNYHQIYSSSSQKKSKYCISIEQFRTQLEILALSEQDNVLPSGLDSFERNSFILTFDDGYESDLEFVIPLLNDFGFKGVFFVPLNAQTLAKSFDKYKKAISQGHTIGAHGVNHQSLKKMMKNEQIEEFEICQEAFKKLIGREIDDFSLPYGQYNRHTLMAALAKGIKRVYGTSFGFSQKGDGNGIIPRWSMNDGVSSDKFQSVIERNPLSFSHVLLESRLKKMLTATLRPGTLFQIQNMMSCR